jgi:murein DD-endopeptidase MepM/ murein hydrolase activator NlpD
MSHIFISYSRKDKIYARDLATDLQKHGFNVWIDDRIDYGTRWWRTIEDAIQNCSAFVIIMTPDSRNSEWVEREILMAQKRNKPIFPLLLSGEEFGLLITTQFANVTQGQMPQDDFYNDLAAIIPPAPKTGAIVSPKGELTPAKTSGQRRLAQKSIWVGLVLVFAFIGAALVWSLRGDKNEGGEQVQAPTPTVIPFMTETSSEATATRSQRATPTQEPSPTPAATQAPPQLLEINVGDTGYQSGTYNDNTAVTPFEDNGKSCEWVEGEDEHSTAYAVWRPEMPLSGQYLIEAWIPTTNATTTRARYQVSGVLGQSSPVVVEANQADFAGDYVGLDFFEFDRQHPDAGMVTLNNLVYEGGDTAVAFCSIRWRKAAGGIPPQYNDGFDSPVGTVEERRTAKIWPGEWLDINPYMNFFFLGYSTGAHLNLPEDADKDAPVYSTADGIVLWMGEAVNTDGSLSGFGTLVIIKHDPYQTTDGVTVVAYSRYTHMHNILVSEGQRVLRGEQIGSIWNTGTDEHGLLFELSLTDTLEASPGFWPGNRKQVVEENFVDPLIFISEHRPADIVPLETETQEPSE